MPLSITRGPAGRRDPTNAARCSYFLRSCRCSNTFARCHRITTFATNTCAVVSTITIRAIIGRLQSTTATGDYHGDGLIDQIHSYGARSFSIWKSDGTLVYDSGADFENFLAQALPEDFNSNNDENDSFDARSDDKGPEPEGITWGKVRGKRLVFVGLERIGGIMVYDITNPLAPEFATYVNNRDFSAEDVESGGVGALGPEGLKFIPWYESPNYKPLLVVGAEVSGTTTIYQVTVTR
ncbi:MAG: hypothetical protein AAGF46_05195 [Pseudomonadota bacterium]